MDMSQYRELFVSESREHLNAFNDLILKLENHAADTGIVDELFRHAHSLKGMAATMQFQPIAELAHRMEDLLSKVRSGELPLTPSMADLMLEGSDILGTMVTMVEAGDDHLPDSAGLANRLAGFSPDSSSRPVPAPGADKGAVVDTSDTAPPGQHQFRQADSFKSVRIRTEILDHLVDITGELITIRYRLSDQAQHYPEAKLDEPLDLLSGLLRKLRDEVFQARMLPFSFVAERFPRLVRDLARRQGKEVSLRTIGEEIELDRGILEVIAEPLVHILRNAVDHGMEMPDVRVAAGKQQCGTISIAVTRDKDHVNIIVADDGRGMDPELLIAKALDNGVINSVQAGTMTPQQAFMLVCTPGFSTAETVSDISGRGVGMDAVRNAIHNLGGALSIESEIGLGSRFILKLPLTVSIIYALLVQCGELTIAFPVNAVDRALELRESDIFDDGEEKICTLATRDIPLKSLNRLLGQPMPEGDSLPFPTVVTGMGDTPVGLLIDRILGQQEIFAKPLGPPLSQLRGITGGTILGDGRIVFVLDINAFAYPHPNRQDAGPSHQ